jgi:hypothetical protein
MLLNYQKKRQRERKKERIKNIKKTRLLPEQNVEGEKERKKKNYTA